MKLALPLRVFHLRSRAASGRSMPPGWNIFSFRPLNVAGQVFSIASRTMA